MVSEYAEEKFKKELNLRKRESEYFLGRLFHA
jgi:hypothetical protein